MTSPDEPFLNDKQKRKFIQDGYIILKGAIPQSNVEQALQHISKGDDEQDANLFDRDGQVPVIKSLFTDTVLSRVADDMLGTGTHRLLGKPQVAVTTKDVSALRLGMKLTDRPAPHKWHVDASRGKFSPLGADFLILFGIALSSGQEVDENRGQFIYFPGSHLKTHARLRELVQTKSPNEVMAKFRTSKPAIGLAFRALLESGDVIVAHQRLAHCPGTNLCDTPRTNIYFRVTHIHFDRLVRSYVNGVEPWLGFNGLSSLIDGAFISFDNPSHSEAKRSDDDEHHDDNIKMENRKLLAARPLGLEKPVLTDTQIQDFVRMGYVTLPGFIGAELLEKATTQIRKVTRLGRVRYNSKRMYPGGEKGVAEIRRPVLLGPQFMDLMYKSGLVDAVEQLIGPMNVVVADGISDVFSIPRSSTKEQDDDAERKEFILDGPLRKGGWHVDTGRARFKGRGFDHLVRVGVCLSDGLGADENRGHVVVWPGSHLKTHGMIQRIMRNQYAGCPPFCYDDQNNGNPTGRPYWQARKNLDCGTAERLLLKSGDSYILHQRLATGLSANASDTPATFAEFRIESVNMELLFDQFNYSELPFEGFEGLIDLNLSADLARNDVDPHDILLD